MKKPNGYVIYRGPSLIDGAPIVAIAITKSTNAKTGNMVQTYILRDDVEPHEAVKTGQDSSVCGDCKHRPANGGSCYVLVFQGPLSVYRAYKRDAYPLDDGYMAQTAATGRMVRLGTYGDPAAVPTEVWTNLLRNASGNTGYTHQWQTMADPALMSLVMASVDNDDEASLAALSGHRYFRIRRADEPLQAREFACPASKEAGYKKSCATCGACNGTARVGQASPVIIVHGSRAGNFAS